MGDWLDGWVQGSSYCRCCFAACTALAPLPKCLLLLPTSARISPNSSPSCFQSSSAPPLSMPLSLPPQVATTPRRCCWAQPPPPPPRRCASGRSIMRLSATTAWGRRWPTGRGCSERRVRGGREEAVVMVVGLKGGMGGGSAAGGQRRTLAQGQVPTGMCECCQPQWHVSAASRSALT